MQKHSSLTLEDVRHALDGSNAHISACLLLRRLRKVSYFPSMFWKHALNATSQGDPVEATNKLKNAIIELEPQSAVLLMSILAALQNSEESVDTLTRTFVSVLFSPGVVRFSAQDAATLSALLSLPHDAWQLAVKERMCVCCCCSRAVRAHVC